MESQNAVPQSEVDEKGNLNSLVADAGDGDDRPNSDVEGSDSGGSWDNEDYPQLELNYDALRHVASQFLPGGHGKCVEIQEIAGGTYHEVRCLQFEDGWSCIGRFTRNVHENSRVTECEYATVKYVKAHTTIPVPETYFVNLDPTHPVGAAFVLMEKMPGDDLYTIWRKLTTEHKKGVVEQIADVLVQLSTLRFELVGSIDMSGAVGPLQILAISEEESGRGPFHTMEEFLFSFMPEDGNSAPEVKELYPEIKQMLHEDLERTDPIYEPPFRLIHGDFDGQNMLFTWEDRSKPPKLSAIIDWDYTYSGPLYYLFEYPIFIRDVDSMYERHLWPENKILRKLFVRTILNKFPKGSDDREDARQCFKQKSYFFNGFRNAFMNTAFNDPEAEFSTVKRYRDGVTLPDEEDWRGEYLPYGGKLHWEADSDMDSEDDEKEDGESA